MSSQRKPARRTAPAPPRPASDHGQDPAAVGARTQQASPHDTAERSAPQKPPTRTRGRQREDTAGPSYPKRPTVPMSNEDFRELKRANAEDDIPTVIRIRAMIALWRENDRFRAQIDKRARRMI